MARTRTGLNVLLKSVLLVGFLLAWTAAGSMPAIAGERIFLAPTGATNVVGTQHTVVAAVVDSGGQPIAGRQVDFAIVAGPHSGITGNGITGQDGQAAFTYTGTSIGQDTIVASFVDADGNRQTSNLSYKRWVEALCGNGVIDPGEDCEPRTLCAGECNPVIGVCFDIGCSDDCTCPCGNGILDSGEECDDGNNTEEDGCSPGCLIEWCPLGVGFWKNHPTTWEVDSLELGKEIYSRAELLAILETPVGSGSEADASLVLAAQMIAAKLNVARGSAIPSEIFFIFVLRDPFFEFPGKLPYHVDPGSPAGEQMLISAGVLDQYNKGKFTPECVTRTRETRRSIRTAPPDFPRARRGFDPASSAGTTVPCFPGSPRPEE